MRLTWTAPGLWAMVTIHLGALLAFHPAARPTPGVLVLAASSLIVRDFALTAGYHRYFSHRAYRTSRVLQFLFALVGGMGVQRSALWWAAHHRAHHRWSDRKGDPHSPREGFWWAHLLWFMDRRHQQTRHDLVKDFQKYPELVFLDRYEWLPLLLFIGITYSIGGFAGWVWAANVGSVVLCHFIFSINSIAHRWGTRPYRTDDDSANNPLVGLVAFGEGWHNNHHRFPEKARLGLRWWQVDLSWYGLWVLEKLGLITQVRR